MVLLVVVMAEKGEPSDQDLAKLGAAFYAIGAKPGSSPEQFIDKWRDAQYEETLMMGRGEVC